MIHGKNLRDQPLNNNVRPYESILKITTQRKVYNQLLVGLHMFHRTLQDDCRRLQ